MVDPVTFARKSRREQTLPERRFWALTLAWRDAGLHWRRQSPIGPYVVDFVCKGKRLIVEIDGETHFSESGLDHDAQRTAYLAERGYRMLRIPLGNRCHAEFESLSKFLCLALDDVQGGPVNEGYFV